MARDARHTLYKITESEMRTFASRATTIRDLMPPAEGKEHLYRLPWYYASRLDPPSIESIRAEEDESKIHTRRWSEAIGHWVTERRKPRSALKF